MTIDTPTPTAPTTPTIPWFWLPLVGIDLETTGFGSGARIVSIATENWERGRCTARSSWVIDPGCPVRSSVKVHGFTDTDLKGRPSLSDVAGEILDTLRAAIPIAYNARFDRLVLHSHWQAASLETIPQVPALDPEWLATDWIDPLPWVRQWDYSNGRTYKSYRLETVAKRYGIEISAHDAVSDVSAMMQLLPIIKAASGGVELGELLRRQRGIGKGMSQ